jgi:hypothetical protein
MIISKLVRYNDQRSSKNREQDERQGDYHLQGSEED